MSFKGKKLAVITGVLLVSTMGIDATNAKTLKSESLYKELIKKNKYPPSENSFCYSDKNGEIKGINIHRKVRLASVTKILVSLFAVDKIGANVPYETKLYVKGDRLHIEGSKDIFNDKRKMFYLVSALNNAGYKKFKKVTFSKNDFKTHIYWNGGGLFRGKLQNKTYVSVYDNPYHSHASTVPLTDDNTEKRLMEYFNTHKWKSFKTDYEDVYDMTPWLLTRKLGLRKLKKISLRVGEVDAVSRPPFSTNDKRVKELSIASPELYRYLKVMNTQSNNLLAQELYESLGDQDEFEGWIEDFISDNFGDYSKIRGGFKKGEETVYLGSGSGLKTMVKKMFKDPVRHDNYATCAIVLKATQALSQELERIDLKLAETLAVNSADNDAKDQGMKRSTLRLRFKSSSIAKTVIAKTGTVSYTSALAGAVSTKSGKHFFGVYNSVPSNRTANARSLQNQVVKELIYDFGGPKKVRYSSDFFFPAKGKIQEK